MSIPERRKAARARPTQPSGLWIKVLSNGKVSEMPAKVVNYTKYGVAIRISVEPPMDATIEIAPGGGAPAGLTRIVYVRQDEASGYVVGLERPSVQDQMPPPEIPKAADRFVDYYELLEVNAHANGDTIHRIYRLLAQRYHPDNPETGDEERFKELVNAYKVLSDPERRAAYDLQHGAESKHRWKVFDRSHAGGGVSAERAKRGSLLQLLYAKRASEPERPALTVKDFEELLGCPREHLEFSLWYLRERGYLERGDNGRYTITVMGVDHAETVVMEGETPLKQALLTQ